jgi:tetraacyldisaccharide 4'-kinase
LLASSASHPIASPSGPPVAGGVRQRYLALVRGERRGVWPTVQRVGLRLAALPYSAAVRVRNLLFHRGWLHSEKVTIPVVSVGNLTTGGTGKTPCVEYVARFYRDLDLRVAILSRGYGSAAGRNDEALVLEENLPDVPHLQGPDRVQLAKTALEELESEILVLDDGFQHRRLRRDLDLVLIDATAPWGYGYLLPRGLMREPPRSLRRARVIALSRCDQVEADERRQLKEQIQTIAPGVDVIETRHQPLELVNSERRTAALELLRNQPIAAFCGLGNPAAFRRTLTDLGANLADFRTYPDHHGYSHADVDELDAWGRRLPRDAMFVTTQKDLVKLRIVSLGGCPLWSLRIAWQVESGRDVLERHLRSVIAS